MDMSTRSKFIVLPQVERVLAETEGLLLQLAADLREADARGDSKAIQQITAAQRRYLARRDRLRLHQDRLRRLQSPPCD
jgi:hypothetical protein